MSDPAEWSENYVRPTSNPAAARILLFLGRRGWVVPFRVVAMLLGGDMACRPYKIFLPHPYGITIRSQCELGSGVVIYQNVSIVAARHEDGPTTIGDRVIIGANSVIVGGIQVGNDAIIGAGSVVTKAVPARTIVAGNPARVLRSALS